MTTIDAKIMALAAESGIQLPADYFKFLDTLSARAKLLFEEVEWMPHSREGLCQEVRINRNRVPAARMLTAHATALEKVEEPLRKKQISRLRKSGFSVDRLSRGFCIGDHGDGDSIFIDSKTAAVYVFHHDGMDVETLTDSLETLIAGSTDVMNERLTEAELKEMRAMEAEMDQPTPDRPGCPHCGKPLLTAKARQCFRCGADWH